jgi:hypothetical protein
VKDKLATGATGASGGSGAWRPWTVWVPSGIGFAWSALLLVGYAIAEVMASWDTPVPGRGWLGAGAIGQCVLAAITLVVLVVGVKRPYWRRAVAVTAWMIIPVGMAWFVLAGRLVARS